MEKFGSALNIHNNKKGRKIKSARVIWLFLNIAFTDFLTSRVVTSQRTTMEKLRRGRTAWLNETVCL